LQRKSKKVRCEVGMGREDGRDVEGEEARNIYAILTKRSMYGENNAKSRGRRVNGDRIGIITLIVHVNFISEVVWHPSNS
jgi:hypothetical protein